MTLMATSGDAFPDADHSTCRQMNGECYGYHCAQCGEATSMYGHFIVALDRVVCDPEERREHFARQHKEQDVD